MASIESSRKRRLEMLVTLPLPRWQIVTAKALALSLSILVVLLVISLVSMGVMSSIQDQIETDLTGTELFTSVLSTYPLVFAMAMLSLFLAAFSANRRFASLIAAAVLVVSYFGSNLADSTKVLEPFESFFLFTYLDASGKAVSEGQQTGDILVLLGVGLVSFILAVIFFQKRRLTVGMWPWQRSRATK